MTRHRRDVRGDVAVRLHDPSGRLGSRPLAGRCASGWLVSQIVRESRSRDAHKAQPAEKFMNGRHPRTPASSPASRTQGALIHRGPGAIAATPLPRSSASSTRPTPRCSSISTTSRWAFAPISERSCAALLSSDIIKGKVAVQRAYADWRRYPQYIVPLSEASIDLIFAPAYGSSKKNATDIRLAIDALELVFTRPEIGTFILLSGDSDFSSLVIKLKEYGKYVIGVGIRESSSDLLVQNCDEYYSYNALAGLVKASDDEPARKYDPWELVTEAVTRMKRNGDVMRSDRLKQVMQEIDPDVRREESRHVEVLALRARKRISAACCR